MRRLGLWIGVLCWIAVWAQEQTRPGLAIRVQGHDAWELMPLFMRDLNRELGLVKAWRVLAEGDSAAVADLVLQVDVYPENQQARRAPGFFWRGQRSYELRAYVDLQIADGARVDSVFRHVRFRGDMVADTVLDMGYCGILECQVRPLESVERLRVQRVLIQRWVSLLRERLAQIFDRY